MVNNTQELRIGNFIYHKGEIIMITMVGLYGIQSATEDRTLNAKVTFGHSLKGIPLTEELLLKCGFEKSTQYTDFTIFTKNKLSIYFPSIMYVNGRTYYNSWKIRDDIPKYMHQLQNLYFALTQEELTIEL